MIKKQQKWITWIVALTFMWLLQVSVMPVAAAGTAEQTRIASAEQGPDYVEAVALKAAPAKKKSILPWVLIGVGVLGITAAVLFLFVLKGYDITGTWDFVFVIESESESIFFTFSGNKTSGTFVTDVNPQFSGTYAVDGKKVTMTVTAVPAIQFIGQFTGKDTMSGTYGLGSDIYNWTATRSAAAASSKPSSGIQSRHFPE